MSYVVTDQRNRTASSVVSIVLTILTAGYFLPWMVAALRGKANAWTVFWINFLLGWTIVFWIVALVMACTKHHVRAVVPYPPPHA